MALDESVSTNAWSKLFGDLIYRNVLVFDKNLYFGKYVCCVKYLCLRVNEFISIIAVGNVNISFFTKYMKIKTVILFVLLTILNGKRKGNK